VPRRIFIMLRVIEKLYNKLEIKQKDLNELKNSYNKSIEFYRSFGDHIDSKGIDEQSNHLSNISKEMSRIEMDILLIKYVINNLED
jgi:hypothetical protein